MNQNSDPAVKPALPADAAAIASLVNRAFAVERFFKDGDRTSAGDITRLMNEGTFLLRGDPATPSACVYVRINGDHGYIGLLSVDPGQQSSGIGSQMMRHAEEFCRRAGCSVADLRIVDVRTELLDYYGKRGYVERGIESAEVIKGARIPVRFILM